MNAFQKIIISSVGVFAAAAGPAAAQDVKIDNFNSSATITDSKIINTSAGIRSTAIVELGSVNAKGGSIKINTFNSKVVVSNSLIVNTAVGVNSRSRVSVGSASTD